MAAFAPSCCPNDTNSRSGPLKVYRTLTKSLIGPALSAAQPLPSAARCGAKRRRKAGFARPNPARRTTAAASRADDPPNRGRHPDGNQHARIRDGGGRPRPRHARRRFARNGRACVADRGRAKGLSGACGAAARLWKSGGNVAEGGNLKPNPLVVRLLDAPCC